MAILVAPAVAQLRVLLAPDAMLAGLAVKEPMVGLLAALLTVKVCETGVAAAYVLLPACVAWIVQAPATMNVAVVPLTVQTLVVVEAKDTVRPELAVAESVSGFPTVCVPGLAKVMVCAIGAALTVKLCETGVAAAYVLLPACVAWIVQAPAAMNVAVVPLTVQTLAVVEAKDTVRPELAVAESVSGFPTVCVPGLAKVMVCAIGAALTVKLCETGVAAAYVLLPACVAWIVQAPATMNVAVVPLTVQTLVVVEAKDTVRPELAVAESVSGFPTVCVPGLAKVMVCAIGAALTVKLCETGVAAAYVLLPACVAWIVQAPAAMNVAVVPLTVQTPVVVEAKDTASPELEVAERVNGVPTVCVPGLAKEIDCWVRGTGFTVSVAALLVTLPAASVTVTVNDDPLSDVVVGGVV